MPIKMTQETIGQKKMNTRPWRKSAFKLQQKKESMREAKMEQPDRWRKTQEGGYHRTQGKNGF